MLECLREAKAIGADAKVYNTAIHVLISARRLGPASALLEEMKSKGIHFDLATFSLWMIVIARNRNASRGQVFGLLAEMDRVGLVPDAAIFNAMFRVRNIRPSEVLHEMRRRRVRRDAFTDKAYVLTSLHRGNLARGLAAMRRIHDWTPRFLETVVVQLRKCNRDDLASQILSDARSRKIDFPNFEGNSDK